MICFSRVGSMMAHMAWSSRAGGGGPKTTTCSHLRASGDGMECKGTKEGIAKKSYIVSAYKSLSPTE